ncbi:RxLR-like protein [Plasmopara halstedii]|uniref:RxLR-like protein n=1 Tax=Plasmopara halstedii TaxID=4781 RepID=A0A0P1ADT7_PLAHL|nr:RxLR-like protein [Plasmopara halstedii]CEG39192.1 RxLR-like protein [Plasmopara halstedii]|eukprot:XP_024575561.1 RxLR-like protein [Plasmopara halstedii]
MRVKAFFAATSLLPVALGWTNRWDHSKRFQNAGHAQLDCDGEKQLASCCLCKSIVFEIETQLNHTQNDYEMDVVFRISEEKKQIKYSRSEARILEVLDDVCESVPLKIPDSDRKTERMLSAACSEFVGVYEDELTRAFFDDFTPAKERMCSVTLQVCPQADKSVEHEDL